MQHLWSVATWNLEITHDAGRPEWIDTPITNYRFRNLASSGLHAYDGEKWSVRLPRPLHLLTAWYTDEYCEQLYVTCIDPRGITLRRLLRDVGAQEDLPKTQGNRFKWNMWQALPVFRKSRIL